MLKNLMDYKKFIKEHDADAFRQQREKINDYFKQQLEKIDELHGRSPPKKVVDEVVTDEIPNALRNVLLPYSENDVKNPPTVKLKKARKLLTKFKDQLPFEYLYLFNYSCDIFFYNLLHEPPSVVINPHEVFWFDLLGNIILGEHTLPFSSSSNYKPNSENGDRIFERNYSEAIRSDLTYPPHYSNPFDSGYPPESKDGDRICIIKYEEAMSKCRQHSMLKKKYMDKNAEYGLKLYLHLFHSLLVDSPLYPKYYIIKNLYGLVFNLENIHESYALTDDPILILGETGTGKELLAKTLHCLSNRRMHPFIPINCGALNDNMLISELFGHVKGAFTGAIRDNPGAFRAAEKGTLFLDEIGDLSLRAQVALLRALNDKYISSLGEAKIYGPVDVRIIAATNKNLKEEVSKGNFRDDLLYRINGLTINLPAIRDYNEDIKHLAVSCMLIDVIREIGAKDFTMLYSFDRHNSISFLQTVFSEKAFKALMQYPFYGNYRELRNVLKAAFLRSRLAIRFSDLPEDVRKYGINENPENFIDEFSDMPYNELRDKYDAILKKKIDAALVENNGNISKTARMLGLPRYKLDGEIKRIIRRKR